MNKTIVPWLVVLLIFSGTATAWTGWKLYQRSQLARYAGASDALVTEALSLRVEPFTLTERSGQPFDLQQLQGEVFVTTFFFANCPSICRQQNAKIKELHEELGPQGVTFLSITCDPENDTPEALSQYADLFDAHPDHWRFLTGEMDEIQRVGRMFQLSVDRDTHSERLIVVDRSGMVRGYYHWDDPREVVMLKGKLNEVLAEQPSVEPGQELSEPTAAGADADWLSEFTLTERSGEPFGSRDLAGEVYVTSFFFSNCPSYCRLQNQRVQELHNEFGERGVRFVSITCDPQTDTPEVLSRYARLFNAHPDQWLFLTGDLTYIRRVGGEIFQVHVDQGEHVEDLIVVDRAGEIRGRYHWNKPPQIADMKKMLKQVLDEPPPATPP